MEKKYLKTLFINITNDHNTFYPTKDYYGVIYRLTSPCGKFYVGLSTNLNYPNNYSTNRHSRFNQYNNVGKTNKQRYLYNAIRLYGFESFKKEVLYQAKTKEELSQMEEYYITIFNCRDRNFGYNLCSGGHRGKHSEETKKLLSIKHKGKKLSPSHVENIRKSVINRWKNPEYIQKMKDYASSEIGKINYSKGQKNKKQSKEHTEKIRKVTLERWQNPEFREKHNAIINSEENKKKRSDVQKDMTVYSFVNKKTGETFTGIKYDLYKKYNLDHGSVCALILKTKGVKSVKGWVLAS